MEGAAYYFNHMGFNKRDITPDFPARHLHYLLRDDKVVHAEAHGVSNKFLDARDWITQRYEDARSNGRVWDRFILNLPYSLSGEQHIGLVREFMDEVSQRRTRFIWAIHGDTDAPHAHAVLVDADVETGRRVVKTSDLGSSYRLRKMWETACNKALSMAGLDLRVSRWGKDSEHHKQLNEQAQQYTRQKRQHASTTALATPMPLPQEKTVAEKVKDEAQDFRDSVQKLLEAKRELHSIETAKQATADNTARLKLAEVRYRETESAIKQLSKSVQERNNACFAAEQYYRSYFGIGASLRKLFSTGLKKRAAQAKQNYLWSLESVERTTDALKRYRAEATRQTMDMARLQATGLGLSRRLSDIGDEQDIADLETMHRANLWHYADRLEMFYKPKLDEALAKGELNPESYLKTKQVLDNRRRNLMDKAAEGYEQKRGYKH